MKEKEINEFNDKCCVFGIPMEIMTIAVEQLKEKDRMLLLNAIVNYAFYNEEDTTKLKSLPLGLFTQYKNFFKKRIKNKYLVKKVVESDEKLEEKHDIFS